MKTLYENKSLPEIKWVEVQSKLQQAQSMESIARKNLEDASLYAPFDGVIGKRNVEAGENVQPGKPVFTLLDVGTVNIKIAVAGKRNTVHRPPESGYNPLLLWEAGCLKAWLQRKALPLIRYPIPMKPG